MESRSHILRGKHESRVSIESTVMPPFRCSLSASHHQHPPSVRAGRSQRQCARGCVANIGRQRGVVPTESCCVDSGTLAADGRARGHYSAVRELARGKSTVFEHRLTWAKLAARPAGIKAPMASTRYRVGRLRRMWVVLRIARDMCCASAVVAARWTS